MKLFNKIFSNKGVVILVLALAAFGVGVQINTAAPTATAQKPMTSSSQELKVGALEVVANPARYLGKRIGFEAKFDKFSTLGLDYARAKRSSQDYIGFLVQRPDVADHNVPLSEMKLFLKRDYAEKFVELDTGDKVQVSGKVFSNALGDAWVDIDNIVILEKVKKDDPKEDSQAAVKN